MPKAYSVELPFKCNIAELKRENERITPPAGHISRKWGQWLREPRELLRQSRKRGFEIDIIMIK
ncbi:MAG: hypothetical protein C0393_02230 [Anaerolinea sp.]|nr:hypothetical protein [Anaerolinea sp.]